ncbi:hypothetical protein [Streptomyces sp. NPDC053755]|uniref:hypothetical protein n=1 Tax=Streptomyces sp. NPDC053755 TaxID=3155815 RepID=UPI003427B8E0
MRRGPTARSAFPLLAAVLVAVQLLTFAASFAYAHTPRHAMANDQVAPVISEATPSDTIVTCHDARHPGDPTGPLRTRDRSRAADHAGISERPSPARPASVAPEPAAPGTPHPTSARPSRAHAPAVLQVFRC